MDVVFGSSSAFAQTVPKPQLIRSSTPPPGEMAALIHAFDWSKSGIGPMARWPESLRTAVNLALGSRFPMLVWCGPDLLMIYNDAYRQLIGDKHPVALGSPGKEALAEIWHIVGPMLQGVMETGEATWAASEMFLLDRHGYAEECYFTFSLSPIVDERGRVAGVFTPVTEMTEKVIGERRLKTLHDLGVWGTRAADAHGACALAAGVLEGNLRDVPFALIYMADPDRSVARLAASAAISREAELAPQCIDLVGAATGVSLWPVLEVLRTGKPALVTGLRERCAALPTGSWRARPGSALALPILLPGQSAPIAVLVCALNPHKRLDAPYQQFLELLAARVATMIADATAQTEERRRAEEVTTLERRVQARTEDLARANAALEAELAERARVARELTRLHDEYRSLISSVRAVLWRGDADTLRLTFVSHEAEALLGYPAEQWLQEPGFWEAHLHPDDREWAKAFCLNASRAGRTHEFEYRMIAADGRVVWVRDLVSVVVGPSGAREAVGVVVDISPLKSAELGLRESETRLRAVIDNSQTIIFLKGVDGRYQLTNQRFCEVFGVSEEGVIGKSDDELFEAQYASVYRAHDLEVQRAGVAMQFEERARADDQSHFYIVSKFPVLDAAGRVCAIGGIATDITERKHSEELIHDLARKQSVIALLSNRALASDDLDELMKEAVTLLAQTLKVEYASLLELLPGGQELLLREGVGWHPGCVGQARVQAGHESLAGFTVATGRPVDGGGMRTAETVVVEDTSSETRFRVPQILFDHGTVSGMNTVIYGADQPFGSLGVHTSTRRRFSDDDKWFLQAVANVLAAAVQRAASEHQIRQSEARLAEAERLAHIGNWEWHLVAGTVTCSEELYRIFGLTRKRFAGTYEALLGCVHPEDRPALRERLQQSVLDRGPFSMELRVVRPTGEIRILQAQGRPRIGLEHDVLGIIVVCLDVTERKSAEAALLETEKRFRVLADAAPIMIWLAGRDKSCTYVNRGWLQFTGQMRDQALGKGWAEAVHPDDLARSLRTYETAFETRTPFSMEYRLWRCDGQYRWILDHGVPRYDVHENFAGYVGSCIDIHERVQLERIQAIHHDTMRAIAGTRDVTATYRGALAAVCEHLQWPLGEVWELAPGGEKLQLAAAWHQEAPGLADFVVAGTRERMGVGEGIPGRVWAARELVIEPDLAHSKGFRRKGLATVAGLQSAVGIPIVGDGEIVGVMTFMFSRVKTIEPALEKTLIALAAQVGAVAVQRAAEQRLRESDERFRLLVEGVRDYAICMLDPDGNVISWNSGAEQIEGYRADEILGRHFSCFYPPDQIASRQPERELAIARAQGRFRDEGWRVRKDGGWFWASFVITATRDASGKLRGFSKVTRDMSERKQAEEDLRDYADRLRALSNRLVEVQENERRRIAAELHDRVGQTFTALNINLNILKTQLPGDEAATSQSRIDDCLSLVEWTVEGIREVMADLRPAVLDDYGLPAALRWYAEQFEQRTRIATRVSAEASISRLAPESEVAIFRIAQEALTNVAKHARATSVDLHLLSNPRAVSLTVVDDGAGFEPRPGPADEHSGWGVMIMRERAEALGGWFSLESAPGQGTRIEATIPR